MLNTKYTIIFFILFIISCLLFFDVIRIDMEDKTKSYPAFISGEPAEMPAIEERLDEVEYVMCSGSKEGQKAVRKAAIMMLKRAADDLGGNGLIDVITSYGAHPTLNKKCPYGVTVRAKAVVFAE